VNQNLGSLYKLVQDPFLSEVTSNDIAAFADGRQDSVASDQNTTPLACSQSASMYSTSKEARHTSEG